MISFYDFLMLNDTSNNDVMSENVLSFIAEIVKADNNFPKNVSNVETLLVYFFDKHEHTLSIGRMFTIAVYLYEYFILREKFD